MELLNPENGSQLTGTATTMEAGRSERATQAKGDEASFWDHGLKEPYTSLIGVTDTVILLSSASEQASRDFAEMLEETKATHPEAVLTIDYREHPHFQEAWLESKTEKFAVMGEFGENALKREIHRHGGAGVAKYIYPEAQLVGLDGEPLNPRKTTLVGMDPGTDDEFGLVILQERGLWMPGMEPPKIDLIWAYMTKGKSSRFMASLLLGMPQTGRNGYAYDDHDLALAAIFERIGAVEFYGDPTGNNRAHDGKSWYSEMDLAAQEFTDGRSRIIVHTSHRNIDRHVNYEKKIPGKRDAFREMLHRMRCLNHPIPRDVGLRAFKLNQYQRRPRNRPGVTEAWQDEHDWTSHITEAGVFVAVHLRMKYEVSTAVQRQGTGGYASPHGILKPVATVPTIDRGW